MKIKRSGFTLAELLFVVAIVGVLVSISIPVFSKQLERSREAVDLSNVRADYSDIMTDVLTEDTANMSRVVKLKQKKDYWQSADPVTIAGVTHYNAEGDTVHWIGHPVANGECEISYNQKTGILLNWKGGSADSGNTGYSFNINENLHAPLEESGVLKTLENNFNFEIDSRCTRSTMLSVVQGKIATDSLLNKGTWAYLGSGAKQSKRYLFWTSVNTNDVGAGKKIPVIISTTDGKYYVSETTTAVRPNSAGNYIAIADHIGTNGYKNYLLSDREYNSLKDAYDAYTKQITDGAYQQYKDSITQ